MLRQLKVRRHLATVLTLLTLLTLTLTRTIRDRLAEAAPPALIASVAAGGSSRLGKVEHVFKKSNARSNEEGDRAHRLTWTRVQQDDSGYVAPLGDGGRAELTIDPALQQRVQRLLSAHNAPYA